MIRVLDFLKASSLEGGDGMGNPENRGRFCELFQGDNAAFTKVQSRAGGALSS